ncbi:MAG: MazG family protein [Micropruina sp.]|nr:MazG family protein [Micropruina sp.]
MPASGVARLVAVMAALRQGCPWDAEQTHLSLVHYLIEETLEVVEAIEDGSDADLIEELGDLLLQVVFHAEIAREQGRFDLELIAERIADKLVARHPYVFADAAVPSDLLGSWEKRKKAEKGRTSSLTGIPTRMSSLARANKVIGRARMHGLDLSNLLPEGDDPGARIVRLVAQAQAEGVDPDQATRRTLRLLEGRIAEAELGS